MALFVSTMRHRSLLNGLRRVQYAAAISRSTLQARSIDKALKHNVKGYATESRYLYNDTSLQHLPDTLEGKVIAVTGAGSGMGQALARLLTQRGAIVSIADVSESALEKTRLELEQLGDESPVLAHKVDVSKASEVNDWIDNTVAKFGRLDGSANIAGVFNQVTPQGALFHEEDYSNGKGWDWVLGVNVTGVANCMRAQLKHMKEKASIVNISSIAGIRAVSSTSAYTASKHAVVGLTRHVAKQYGPLGIRINTVAPGAVQTAMLAGARETRGAEQDALVAGNPMPRRADPEEVAKVIMFLLSHDASFVTGAVWSVDGGMCA